MARMMPCSTPMTTTVGRGEGGHRELVAPDPQDVAHPHVVDQPDPDEEDDRREDRVRHVGQRAGQEQQDHDDDGAGGELRDLAPAAGAVDHLGLGRAAVDRERAGHAGADRLATPSPTRSTFSSKLSPYLTA